jgi:excisionase family DNA binding protein
MTKMDKLTDEDSALLTVAQACKFLRVSKKKLYRLNRDGLIGMRKLGHSTMLYEAELRRYLADLPHREAEKK